MENDLQHQLALIAAQTRAEIERIEANQSAKETAGKAIGSQGLMYITLIMAMGIGASLLLDNEKIAAVMGLLSAALMALIQMLNGIAGTAPKQERPEFLVINSLIERLDKLSQQEPMQVTVENGKVKVTKGQDSITTQS